MICLICNEAETLPGRTSVLLGRHELSLTFHNVPARICPHCGEAYTDEAVAANILQHAETLASAGAKVDTLEYASSED